MIINYFRILIKPDSGIRNIVYYLVSVYDSPVLCYNHVRIK